MNKREKVEKLYDTYRDVMFREANKILDDEMCAEDAVSESFVRIIKNLDKIEADGSIRTLNFLVLVCRNVAKDIYNRRKRESKVFCSKDEALVLSETPEDIVINRESVNKIVDIISSMDPIYKDVLILRKIYGVSRCDIAKLFGITDEAVTKRLQRAKKQIKKQLREEDR